MTHLNPGPNKQENFVQPDYRAPVVHPSVGATPPINKNPMRLDGPNPTPPYVQPGT
jgi:hypothetical protein